MSDGSADESVLCMHNSPPSSPDVDPQPGSIHGGVVVCAHVYGLGVYLPNIDRFGHVNVTAMGSVSTGPRFDGYPRPGSRLRLELLGTTDTQLRLAVTESVTDA